MQAGQAICIVNTGNYARACLGDNKRPSGLPCNAALP